jgi:hypothetical protein
LRGYRRRHLRDRCDAKQGRTGDQQQEFSHGAMISCLSEGLCPSDSPARSLARRCAGALRSRGSLAQLARISGSSRDISRLIRGPQFSDKN